MSDVVEIVEVGPRDGLQNEPGKISVAQKVALIDHLSEAGFARIEAVSFVSPRWVPQMAGAADVMGAIKRVAGVRYTALTPNMHGFAAALQAGVDEVAIFGSASEGFSKANINATIAESLTRFEPVLASAREAAVPVRGYVSCVVDCPYDGPVAPSDVARVTEALFAMGVHEVSLGDTLGRGTPDRIDAMLDAVLDVAPAKSFAGHFHDTSGQALQNVDVALDRGVRVFDTAIGGLGGCPFAPGAAGNLATEALAMHLDNLGLTHGLDAAKLAAAARFAKDMRKAN